MQTLFLLYVCLFTFCILSQNHFSTGNFNAYTFTQPTAHLCSGVATQRGKMMKSANYIATTNVITMACRNSACVFVVPLLRR